MYFHYRYTSSVFVPALDVSLKNLHMTEKNSNCTSSLDLDDAPFYQTLPKSEKQQHELIYWWHTLLRENSHYEDYCDARRADNDEARRAIENEFPKISEVFADFGDIYSNELRLGGGPSSKGWQRWLTQRLNTFFPHQAKIVSPAYVPESSSRRTISIPAEGRRNEILALVEVLVKSIYAESEAAIYPLEQPKYKIKKDKISAYLNFLEKASFVNDLLFDEEENRKLSVEPVRFDYSADEIELLIQDIPEVHDIGFTWTRNDEKGRYDPSDNRKQIKRMSEKYEDWIDRSVEGRFPGMAT